MRGLYIHIPFCKHVCNYCDFHKRIAKNDEQIKDYINRLINELNHYKGYLNDDIVSIYIGGGTPNFLNNYYLELILKEVAKLNLKVEEYTIEINPELLTIDQINLFNKYGINRISLGAQNFIDNDLIFLGRHHTRNDIINSVNLLKNSGITNISIDLMFGFPGDTIEKIKENLKLFYELELPHISYYSMILEEKTKFYIDYQRNKLALLDEDLLASMYEYIRQDLKEHGFKQYEISNYSKNRESIHNKIYWNNHEYVGVGSGASGYLDGIRYENNAIMSMYFNDYINTKEELTLKDKKSEFMILGLRLLEGVSIRDYFNRYNSIINDDFDLEYLLNNDLIIIENDFIRLSERGLMLGNIVFERFI